jgi:AAA domain
VASRTADSTAGLEFLNSLIMGDLGLVAEHTAKGDVGGALREYLRPEAEIRVDQRVDVRERIGATLTGTAPDVVPAGRWPSDPAHALALSQQLAVSTALGMGDTGIMGVNGPPGTGKTTMLRDLIAALVVARAARLAALSDPAKAFTSKRFRWLTAGRTRVINAWRRELTGFEMVVASANNGAVENVTNEIPAADAIDAAWREQAAAVDYFPTIATALLAPDQVAEGKQVTGPDGWALVAARLGNKQNRSRFVSMFWYHKPDEPEDDNPWYGLLHVLKDYEETGPVRPWSAAVADFHAVAARVDAIRAERSTVYRQVQRRARIDEELAELRRSVAAATDVVAGARQRLDAAVAAERELAAEAEQIMAARRAETERVAHERVADAERLIQDRAAEVERIVRGRRAQAEQAVRSREHELSRRWDAHAQHRENQPGWWAQVRTFGGVSRRWTRQDTWLDAQMRAARQDIATAQRDLDLVQQAVDKAERTVDAARRQLDAARHVLVVGVPVPEVVHKPLIAARREQALAEHNHSKAVRTQADTERTLADVEAELVTLDDALKQAGDALGRHSPDADWWTDRERRELAALWTDPAWNRARSELFLAALALHKEFLRHTARVMRGNLQAAMDVVNSDAPADLAADAALAAWQSLFFVVPVVSTTFASYARLFGHLGTEALGWLLVDEAGQATPQNAVGALWRAKRALVVGDPLQLKPITTLPFPAEQAIRNDFGVDEQWLTSRTSVQQIADRLTPLGTWLPGQDDRTWVGVPLIVHRRCDQPMFDVVNAAAYDGLMIDGTGDGPRTRFDEKYPTLPPSKWIDVISTGARGHWIPDEGHQLDRILDTLVGLDFDMSDVMMIGPFKDIARQLKNRAKPHSGLTAGTIHTAQGKQADVVILVLGSDPERQGARNWASSEPNLLNVAVSRAKRRLYVIGNRTLWGGCRYFRVLASELPHTAPVVRNELP